MTSRASRSSPAPRTNIRKATALALLRRRWAVAATGRVAAKTQAVAAELRAAVPTARVDALVGNLSVMADVHRVAQEFRAAHGRLDLLLLNANTITQRHTLTAEGFEANLAVGYLGRALLTWALEDVLRATDRAQVVTVVGLNLERLNLDDPSSAAGFSSMKALGRWQWAMQVFTREWNRRVPTVAMNVYMPGLVRTKILADEPQPMRFIVQLANRVMGVPVAKAGDELCGVIEELHRSGTRDAYYARTRRKPPRALGGQPGDGERLWQVTQRLLQPWCAPASQAT